jgi:hypothetical protein
VTRRARTLLATGLACLGLPAAAGAVPISGVQVNVVSLLRVDVTGFVKPAAAANVCGVNLLVTVRNARGAAVAQLGRRTVDGCVTDERDRTAFKVVVRPRRLAVGRYSVTIRAVQPLPAGRTSSHTATTFFRVRPTPTVCPPGTRPHPGGCERTED